jgi:hypothetical protein
LIKTEYLMTLHAKPDPPQAIDSSLLVVDAPTGGWVEGLGSKERRSDQLGDWLRAMLLGILHVDVRETIKFSTGSADPQGDETKRDGDPVGWQRRRRHRGRFFRSACEPVIKFDLEPLSFQ